MNKILDDDGRSATYKYGMPKRCEMASRKSRRATITTASPSKTFFVLVPLFRLHKKNWDSHSNNVGIFELYRHSLPNQSTRNLYLAPPFILLLHGWYSPTKRTCIITNTYKLEGIRIYLNGITEKYRQKTMDSLLQGKMVKDARWTGRKPYFTPSLSTIENEAAKFCQVVVYYLAHRGGPPSF